MRQWRRALGGATSGPTPRAVDAMELGVAERVNAIIEMTQAGRLCLGQHDRYLPQPRTWRRIVGRNGRSDPHATDRG